MNNSKFSAKDISIAALLTALALAIPLFMPIIHKKFSLARIVTGSKAELVFKVLMLLLLFISIGLAALIFLNIM